MSTSSPRREGVLSGAPKFFKIILDPLADTLRIPAEFRRRYGQNLPSRVFLKVPSGTVLEVEVIHSNGETLLRKGWLEFKNRFSIEFGHLLVFKYDKNSQFDVLIFDSSASEINYPFDADFGGNQAPKVEDNGTESSDSIVLLEQFSTGNRGKAILENLEESDEKESDVSIEVLENPLARQQHRRKRRLCDEKIGFSSPTYHFERALRSRVKLEESTSGLKFGEECNHHNGRQFSNEVQKQIAVAKETCIAYKKALAFARVHAFLGPFFISLMQPSYVSNNYSMHVQLLFARENLPRTSTNLTIRLMNGKAWPVRCIIAEGSCNLSSGWKDFVQDNALKVGDACIFEATKNTKDLVWNVIIFRS